MTMQKLRKSIAIAVIVASLGSLYFVPWLLVKAWILPLPNTIQEQLVEAVDHGFSGVVVYIDQAGQPPRYLAAGWHNRDAEIPATPQALFKIASISKLYDAVAVSKLVHQGRLSLEKTIADYLPELATTIEYADEITLKLMVQHRSGIANFTDTENFWLAPTTTYEQSLALIEDKPAEFKPGEAYQYSNTNYLLIHKIVNNELGYHKFQFIQEEILKPLNLENTFSSLREVDITQVMSGYHVGYSEDLKANDHGMHATAEDVGKFLRALNNGSLFKAGEQAIYSSIYEYQHSGWVPGYQSFANYYKDLDTVVIAFYSTTDPKLYNWNLAQIINNRLVKILNQQSE